MMVEWILFNTVVGLLLALDLFRHRKVKSISLRQSLLYSLFWIALALLFAFYIYFSRGSEAALAYTTGYLVEKSLSVDNLFVFLLIFRTFQTPQSLLHTVLFWGVFGAIVMRGALIIFGITLFEHFPELLYLFGAFLLYLGIKYAFFYNQKLSPDKNLIVRFFTRHFALTSTYEGHHFFVKKEGKLLATPLFVVLLAIETTDLIFACDSIPAILVITQDPFIAYTSNILAVLGLRSLYTLLHTLLDLFIYLHYGLSAILIFIGFKMLIHPLWQIPMSVSLIVIASILILTLIFSWLKKTSA